MPLRDLFVRSRHREAPAPVRSQSPLPRCAPPARGSTPTAHLVDVGEVHRDFEPLLESISAAGKGQRRQRTKRQGLGRHSGVHSPVTILTETPLVSPSLAGSELRRRSLTILPPHRESILTLVAPVTVYSLDLGFTSVNVPESTGQHLVVHFPTPVRPGFKPFAAGPYAQAEPENIAEWLEEQIYESPSESSSSSRKDKGKACADEPLSPDTKPAENFKGKGPALELADYISDDQWNDMLAFGPFPEPVSPSQKDKGKARADEPMSPDEKSTRNFKGKGPALEPADSISDEQWSHMLAFDPFPDSGGQDIHNLDPFHDFSEAFDHLAPHAKNGESSAAGARRATLSPDLNPTADEFEPTSSPPSEYASPESYIWSSIDSLNVEAPEFVPGELRRMPGMLFPSMSEVNALADEIDPDSYNNPSIHTAQAIFAPSQSSIASNPRRIQRIDGTSSGPEFRVSPPMSTASNSPPQPIPTDLPPVSARVSSPPLRYVPSKGFFPDLRARTGDLSSSVAGPSSAAPGYNFQAYPSGLPVLHYVPDFGFVPEDSFPDIDLSDDASPPHMPIPELRVINGSVSSSSASDDGNLPEDPSRLRPSDADRLEQVGGPEVEEMKADVDPQEIDRPSSRLGHRDSDNNDDGEETFHKQAEPTSDFSSDSLSEEEEFEEDETPFGEFQLAFSRAVGPAIPPEVSEPSISVVTGIHPFSAEGRMMVNALRSHFSMPEDTPALAVQDFFSRNPEIIRALFMSRIPHPRWQFWEANHLHEVNLPDRQAQANNLLLARWFSQLEWTEEPIVWTLDAIKRFMADDHDYAPAIIMTKTFLKNFAGRESAFAARRGLDEGDERQLAALERWAEYVQKRKDRSGSLLIEEVFAEE